MIRKEIFGALTLSPLLYEAQHNAILATVEAFGSQSHPDNPATAQALSHAEQSPGLQPPAQWHSLLAAFPGVAREDQRLRSYWSGAVNACVTHGPWSSEILPFHAAIAQQGYLRS